MATLPSSRPIRTTYFRERSVREDDQVLHIVDHCPDDRALPARDPGDDPAAVQLADGCGRTRRRLSTGTAASCVRSAGRPDRRGGAGLHRFRGGARRPGGHLGAEQPRLDRRFLRHLLLRAVLVPLNTRFKGAEAGHVLRTAEVRLLFTVTDFLGTDYVRLLDGVTGLDALAEIVVLHGPAPSGPTSWPSFTERADSVRPARWQTRRRGAVGPDEPVRHHLHLGHDRAAQGRDAHATAPACAPTSNGSDVVGLRRGDRYLIVVPVLPHRRLKSGVLACILTGLDHRSSRRCSTRPRSMARVAEESITMLPGPPAMFQSMLNDPHSSLTTTLSSLRLAVTGAAAVPVELIERHARASCTLRDGRHRLRPDRDHRHGRRCAATTTTPRSSPTRRAAPSPASRSASSTTTDAELPRGRAGRGAGPRLHRDAGLLRRSGRDGRGHRRRRLAAHRRRRRARRRRQPAHHRPQEGHVHRRRLQRLSGRDREHDPRPSRRSPRWRWSACPTSAWARSGRPSSCLRPGSITRRRRVPRLVPRADGELQGAAARSSSSRPCRSTPPARC